MVFEGVLVFFQDVGVYTVVLPFLLVFTLVFALLEKTKVLGLEKIGDNEYPKKNLNAMIAFCAGFFVVASAQLVSVINQVVANSVLLLLLLTLFMLLVGSMDRDKKEGFQLDGWPRKAFMAIMFVGILLVFLDATGWLYDIWFYLISYWDTQFVGMIILLAVIIALMFFVTSTPKHEKEAD